MTTKQNLVKQMYQRHKAILSIETLYSFRRRGFGIPTVSWATVGQSPSYESFFTMAQCAKYPTRLEQIGMGKYLVIVQGDLFGVDGDIAP